MLRLLDIACARGRVRRAWLLCAALGVPLPVAAAAVFVDGATVRTNFTSTDTFRVSGRAPGLSSARTDGVTLMVDGFTFTVGGDQLVQKGKTLVYRATGDDPGLSLLRLSPTTGRFVVAGKHLALSGLSNPFALQIGSGSALDCVMVAMASRGARGRRKRGSTSRIQRFRLRGRRADTPCEFLLAPHLEPGGILVGQRTTVRTEITLAPGGSVDAGSVQLFRADAGAKPVGDALCTLADDGNPASGDAAAGDGRFTCLVPFDESAPATIALIVTATAAGTTVFSTGVVLAVVPPLTTDDAQAILSVQETAGHTWAMNQAAFGDTLRARTETILALRVLPGVADAGLAPDGLCIWIDYESGVEGGLMLSPRLLADQVAPNAPSMAPAPPVVRGGTTSAASAAIARAAVEQRPLVEKPTVLLWDPGFFDDGKPAYDPQTGHRDAPSNSEVGDLQRMFQESVCPVFAPEAVVVVHGPAATRDSLRDLTAFGTVVLVTHGGFYRGDVCFVTAETPLLADLVTDGAALQLRDFGLETIGSTTYYTVGPSFIRGLDGTFGKSIIYAGFCDGQANPTLATAFLDKGAATYFGYTKEVTSMFSHQVAVKLFTSLLPGNLTASDAFDRIEPKGDYFLGELTSIRIAKLRQSSSPSLDRIAYVGTPDLQPAQSTVENSDAVDLAVTVPGTETCSLLYQWTNTAAVGHTTDGAPGHVDNFMDDQKMVTYTADCSGTGTDTIGVAITATGANEAKKSLGMATATVEVQAAPSSGGPLSADLPVCVPTTTTTLPSGGAQFFISPNICNVKESVAGQSCNPAVFPNFLCVCSAGGHVVANNVFYAYPGDSVSIECSTCGQQCVDYSLSLNNSIPLFPQEHVCLASPPPPDTFTTIVDKAAPIPVPFRFHQLCCQLPSAHCAGGANDGASCRGPSDCPNGTCLHACFEFVVGSTAEQDCAQMGGDPLANYCGVYGVCGAD